MKTVNIKSKKITPAIVKLVAGALESGQILVLPTDTIYGLSCRADDPLAIKRIYKLKERDPKRPLIILVSDLAMLKRYASLSSRQASFLKKIWGADDRPTTIVLAPLENLPRELYGAHGSLALRLPKSEFLIKIIKKLKRPIVSTSLNLSGQESIMSVKRLSGYFPATKNGPDLIVDQGYCRRRRPSRLIDLRDGTKPLILRK